MAIVDWCNSKIVVANDLRIYSWAEFKYNFRHQTEVDGDGGLIDWVIQLVGTSEDESPFILSWLGIYLSHYDSSSIVYLSQLASPSSTLNRENWKVIGIMCKTWWFVIITSHYIKLTTKISELYISKDVFTPTSDYCFFYRRYNCLSLVLSFICKL